MVEYSKIEFLAACASRHVKDKENVFGGTGLPLLAALLAKASPGNIKAASTNPILLKI